MGGPGEYYARQKKPDVKGQIVYGSTYMKCLDQQIVSFRETAEERPPETGVGWAGEEGGGVLV